MIYTEDHEVLSLLHWLGERDETSRDQAIRAFGERALATLVRLHLVDGVRLVLTDVGARESAELRAHHALLEQLNEACASCGHERGDHRAGDEQACDHCIACAGFSAPTKVRMRLGLRAIAGAASR